jgi:tetratricopeptide (TPR) repeat protein
VDNCPPGVEPDWERRGDTHTGSDPCSAPSEDEPDLIDELGSEVEALLDAREWTRARWLIEARLQSAPEDHRLHAQYALTWIGDLRLAEARWAIDRAALLAPRCPAVLSIRGAVLDALGDTEKAIAVLGALTERGPGPLLRGPCRIESSQAKSLLSDAWLRLARLYEARGERELQSASARRHLLLAAAGSARVNVLHRPGVGMADALWHRLRGPSEPSVSQSSVH